MKSNMQVTYLNRNRLRIPRAFVVALVGLRALVVDITGLRALAVDLVGLRALVVDLIGLRALALDRGHLDGRRIFFSALQTDCTHDHISETGQSWLREIRIYSKRRVLIPSTQYRTA
jgi:hypothetical protein